MPVSGDVTIGFPAESHVLPERCVAPIAQMNPPSDELVFAGQNRVGAYSTTSFGYTPHRRFCRM